MLFSIITPLLQNDKKVFDNIISVKKQNYNSVEHIIIYKNTSKEFLENLYYINPKIKFLNQENAGIYQAINLGLAAAQGDSLLILNSDDFLFDENVLLRVANLYKNNKFIDLIFGGVSFVLKENRSLIVRTWLPKVRSVNSFSRGWSLPHSSLFIKKNAIKVLGFYLEEFTIASDFEYILRALIKHNMKFYVIESSVVIKELGGVSTSYSDGLTESRINLNNILKIYNIKKHSLYYFYRYLEKLKQFHLTPHKYNATWLYK